MHNSDRQGAGGQQGALCVCTAHQGVDSTAERSDWATVDVISTTGSSLGSTWQLLIRPVVHPGHIQESLKLFQQATALDPQDITNLKQASQQWLTTRVPLVQQTPAFDDSARSVLLQVGRSLFLLGKHRAAGEVYDEALRLQEDDAELWLHKGMCAAQLRDYDRYGSRSSSSGSGNSSADTSVWSICMCCSTLLSMELPTVASHLFVAAPATTLQTHHVAI